MKDWHFVAIVFAIALVLAGLHPAAAEDILLTTDQRTCAWDRPINYVEGQAVQPTDDIRYNVYLKVDGSDGSQAVKLTAEPVAETQLVLTVPQDGQTYRFGVQSLLFVNGTKTNESTISWSDDSEVMDGGNTIALIVPMTPGRPTGLRNVAP